MITRDDLVQELARVSHATWMRQAADDPYKGPEHVRGLTTAARLSARADVDRIGRCDLLTPVEGVESDVPELGVSVVGDEDGPRLVFVFRASGAGRPTVMSSSCSRRASSSALIRAASSARRSRSARSPSKIGVRRWSRNPLYPRISTPIAESTVTASRRLTAPR